ncbi:MAG: hypothetical protein WCD18_03805 [Thermosynechococcaceae cyanobacterium]
MIALDLDLVAIHASINGNTPHRSWSALTCHGSLCRLAIALTMGLKMFLPELRGI